MKTCYLYYSNGNSSWTKALSAKNEEGIASAFSNEYHFYVFIIKITTEICLKFEHSGVRFWKFYWQFQDDLLEFLFGKIYL